MAATTQAISNRAGLVLIYLWLLLPALRPVYKFVPDPEMITAVLASGLAVLVYELDNGVLRRVFIRHAPLLWRYGGLVVALGLLVVSVGVYPHADGLKLHGGGSDADDAMMLGGQALLHGMNPYIFSTYLGNPFSPGPGWLALLAPMKIFYPIVTGLALLLVVGMLMFKDKNGAATPYAVLVASCLLVWEMAGVGNDLVAWGLLLAAVCLTPVTSTRRVVFLGLLLGCLATARIAFLYVPILYGCAYRGDVDFRKWFGSREVWVARIGLASAVVWHTAFWLWTDGVYAPLHLLGRAEGYAHGWALAVAVIGLAVCGLWMFGNWRKARPEVLMAVGLGAPMAALAGLDLVNSSGALGAWEGATYLMPVLPLVVLAGMKLRP